ncbi:MAG: hypothetical protein CV088_09550 [Nitrospira sp. LK70]|nr:hypothetical protein [Nitrospira sp. LK70]
MLGIIFTLDYEIHGNGEGNPYDLMIEPTERLLRLCEQFGAKLTIMADVAEILKFKEYKEENRQDDYSYDAIVDQLRGAITNGHDVQLHIHSSYFNATHDNGYWIQDWSEYDFARLPYERMSGMIGLCKQFLESLLRPVDSSYRCVAFRAANWSVSPSKNVVQALIEHGISIDTSIFKYGRRKGVVNFDYSQAYSPIVPWRVKEDDMCGRDDTGSLWELPIYSERRWIGAFLTWNRFSRALMSLRHRVGQSGLSSQQTRSHATPAGNGWLGSVAPDSQGEGWLATLLQRHAWKADFNQCGGGQLINALHRASDRYDPHNNKMLPFILIGHPKLFTKRNEKSLSLLLRHCAKHPDKFEFGTLKAMHLSLRNNAS